MPWPMPWRWSTPEWDAVLDVLARHKAPGAPDRDAFSSAVEQQAVKDIVGATDHAAEEASKLLESGQIDAALTLLRSDAIAAGKAAAMRWRRSGEPDFQLTLPKPATPISRPLRSIRHTSTLMCF